MLGPTAHSKQVMAILGRPERALNQPVEHNLGDHGVVGHHHSHGAEEGLQVVGQLGASGVTCTSGDLA